MKNQLKKYRKKKHSVINPVPLVEPVKPAPKKIIKFI